MVMCHAGKRAFRPAGRSGVATSPMRDRSSNSQQLVPDLLWYRSPSRCIYKLYSINRPAVPSLLRGSCVQDSDPRLRSHLTCSLDILLFLQML